jgi:4-hydroxybenzoate polyprenyltransferase
MLRQLRQFLEMIRFSHTLFALPFALLSATLAWYTKPEGFQTLELVGILLCMVFARSAAMGFNRLADRRLDADNPRTAGRHLPAGKLSVATVGLFTTLCGIVFVASAAIFLLAQPANPWPLILAVPVLLFICGYSLTKRFTALAHFWLGASLLLAPLAAWIAIQGLEGLVVPVVLGLAVLFWVAGFDIIYACQDAEYDKMAGLHSVPAALGVPGALRVAVICHMLMIVMLVVLSWVAPYLGVIYLCGVTAVAVLLVYEHFLVSPADLTRLNLAFFNVNAVVSLGLFLIVLLQLYLAPVTP